MKKISVNFVIVLLLAAASGLTAFTAAAPAAPAPDLFAATVEPDGLAGPESPPSPAPVPSPPTWRFWMRRLLATKSG